MNSKPSKPRVVIVGGGFGGLFAAKALKHAPVDVILIDKTNHHVFQPLLYQVATAGLSPADIAQPIRGILSRQRNVEVWRDEVEAIDLEGATVVGKKRSVRFDFLILATGARHAYFGHSEWERFAPGLKTLEDALQIRQNILNAFERAEICADPREREALLKFVVIGAGPTGVEMAGSIAELAKRALSKDFRNIDPTNASIVLIEAGPRVLSNFDEALSSYASKALEGLGVQVLLNTRVESIDENSVSTTSGEIACATKVWAAGVQASGAGAWLGIDNDRAGRAIVERDCSIFGRLNVFVIGDTMAVPDASGHMLPGVSQVAMQQAKFVADTIASEVKTGTRWIRDFNYWDKGSMATIGRRKAVAQVGEFRFGGPIAWLLWLFIHIWYLIGFENKLLVLLQWMWSYITFHRGARLITADIQ